MFQSGVRHLHNQFIRRETVCANNERVALSSCCVKQGTKLFECDLLLAEVNRRRGAAGDADDLLVKLRAERKAVKWHRNGDARLQNKIRAEQQKEHEQKKDIE